MRRITVLIVAFLVFTPAFTQNPIPYNAKLANCKRVMATAIVDETTAWVVCGGQRRHRLVRIDPQDNRVVAEIPIKKGGHVLVIDSDAVWVTDGTYRSRLHKIDPMTNEVVQTIRIEGPPLESGIRSLTMGRDALWIATTELWIIRIDKHTGQEQARIRVPGGAATLAIGEDAVWALSTKSGVLSQIDKQANRIVRTISTGRPGENLWGPCHLGPVLAAGSVWVVSAIERTVSRIDPESGRVAVTIPVRLRPARITTADDNIWIDQTDGSRLKIDPRTNQIVGRGTANSTTMTLVEAGEFDPPAVHSPLPQTQDLDDLVLRSAEADPEASEYRAEGQTVDLEFLTPPVIRSLALRDEISAHDKYMGIASFTPGKDFFRWSEYGEGSAAVVVIQAIPKIKNVSNLEGLAYGSLGALVNPKDRALQPSFRYMKLLRDGIEITPIDSRRRCGEFTIRLLYPEGDKKWQDRVFGCYGSYAYDPEVFETGVTLTLQVSTEGKPEPESFTLGQQTIQRIHSDF